MVRHINIILCTMLTLMGVSVQAQTVCDPADFVGSNLVTNGDFESGDVGFTTDIGYSWNASGAPGTCYSESGQYYVGTSPQDNVGGCQFQGSWGYTAYEGNNFMMIDGDEDPNSVTWGQTISGIETNTYYYFSVAVTSLSTGNLAQLKFEIDGVLQDTTLDAPATPGDWIVYNQIWYSGAVSGSITIEITDQRPGCGGCPDNNDYGLDAIIFEKGCPDDAFDEQPELGDDQTFCGTNGTITLDPGVTLDVDNTIYWSTGVNDDDETIDVTIPGTYYVCVNETGTCTKVDSITITDDYSVNIGNDTELCNPAEVTMDAGHSGIGVSYQWFLDDVAIAGATSKTYTANSSGEYKVLVEDDNCDDVADSINVTVKANQPDPSDIEFCIENNPDTTLTFTVTPAGTNYDWYDTESAVSTLPGGSGTDSFTRSGITNDGDTLWVKDNTLTTYPSTGPTDIASATPAWGYTRSNLRRGFTAYTDLTIVEVTVITQEYQGPCNGKCCGAISDPFTIELTDNLVPDQTATVTAPCGTSSTVPLGFSVGPGSDYRLGLDGVQSDNVNGWFKTNTTETGTYDITDVFQLDSKINSGMFFDWVIEAESACERVPVYATNDCFLPVEFAYINVKNVAGSNIISWGTAQELNNSHFEVLRSTDGRKFEVIGVVNGFGNSDELIQYQFEDNQSSNGIAYYRLRQVDYDGQFEFSDIVSITNSQLISVNAFPNPFNESIHILVNTASDEPFNIEVFDVLGIKVYQGDIKANEELIIGNEFSAGVYLINIVNDSEKKVLKVVKK